MNTEPNQPDQKTSEDTGPEADAVWPPQPGHLLHVTGARSICVTATKVDNNEWIVLAVLPDMSSFSCYAVWYARDDGSGVPLFTAGDYGGSLPKALESFNARVARNQPREEVSRD